MSKNFEKLFGTPVIFFFFFFLLKKLIGTNPLHKITENIFKSKNFNLNIKIKSKIKICFETK